MRNIQIAICVIIAVLALPAVKVKGADEFTKVPVLVNVLKGVVMSDADIDDMIKEANKILNPDFPSKSLKKSENLIV